MSTQYALVLGVDPQPGDEDYGDGRVALVETDLWDSWPEAHDAGLRVLGQSGRAACAQLAAQHVGCHEYDTTLERAGHRKIAGFTIEPYYDAESGDGFTGQFCTHTNIKKEVAA